METLATCSTTDGNGSYHGLAPSFFEELTRCRRQKHCRWRPENANGPSKFRKISRVPSAFTSVYVCAIETVVPRLTVAAVATLPYRRISKRLHVADIKNLIGDGQATLTVDRNSAIYVYLRLHDCNWRSGGGSAASGGFWRSLKRHVTNIKKHRRDDQDRSKFCKYENLCLRNQAKRLEKLLFPATNAAAIDGIAHFSFLLSLATAFVFTLEK